MLESQNKKIVILGDPIDNQRAGIHVYTRELVRAMAEVNRQQDELILIREIDKQPFEGLRQYAFRNIHYPIGYASFRLFLRIPLFMRKLKPDVVIEPAHFGPFNMPKSSKSVTVIHDLTPLKFPHWHRWHSQLLQRVFLPGILKRTDLVIVNSHHTKKDLLSFFPDLESKTKVIYPGLNPSIRKSDQAPQLAGLDRDYFLYAGTIEPRKRVDQLLQAYALWRKSGKGEEKLVIVGERGWKTAHFDRALASHPYQEDILLTGFVSDNQLSALYTHCKLFIYPSAYEGFGFPVLEALSCGAKVLTAKNSSLTEVGGEAVTYFYEGGDVGQNIFEALEAARKHEVNQSERERIASFTWKATAHMYFEALDSL
jgi:glycosyltransferase involved in cell wall biosynthesis